MKLSELRNRDPKVEIQSCLIGMADALFADPDKGFLTAMIGELAAAKKTEMSPADAETLANRLMAVFGEAGRLSETVADLARNDRQLIFCNDNDEPRPIDDAAPIDLPNDVRAGFARLGINLAVGALRRPIATNSDPK